MEKAYIRQEEMKLRRISDQKNNSNPNLGKSSATAKSANLSHAETKPSRPTSIYAITKHDQEEMALAIGEASASLPLP